MFKDHPALAGWKGADEPQWGNMNTHGKRPPASIATTYKLVHELDPNHPVLVIQAPRGTAADNAVYDPYLDVTGMDVFPIGYPPGGHVPNWPNKEISMVGDWTKIIVEAAQGKPVWMTLQISFSGVSNKGKTLRFPTFPQERFMTYEAIINGARGINYFGGGHRVAQTLNERDRQLGYNWTFWERILKPLLAEINEKSPLHEALLAPNSKLPVKAEGAPGVEFTVREVARANLHPRLQTRRPNRAGDIQGPARRRDWGRCPVRIPAQGRGEEWPIHRLVRPGRGARVSPRALNRPRRHEAVTRCYLNSILAQSAGHVITCSWPHPKAVGT